MTCILETIRQNVIGEGQAIETPFGMRPLVYADYTASGRSLGFIESFIQRNVLPFYANTHTETSHTGRQTTALREQARDTIRAAVNASEAHKVLFCGAGATAAVDKLIGMLGLRLPAQLNDRHQWLDSIPEDERPVIFVGPYEHHSNELPWRETIATVVPVPLGTDDCFDMAALEVCLQEYQHRPLKLGSFSAASNVTGLKSPVAEISKMLKSYGVWSCWDYAAAAPYVGIDVHALQLDAVYISPHKFVGGPGTPGILVVNEAMLSNRVPAVPGGGTVSFVRPDGHTYLNDIERREEGGTPAIVESIRAGLVFQLQQSVGTERIEALEHAVTERAISRLQAHPNIEVLGNREADRLSILSLRIAHNDKHLHYSFVVALLNDLFGIQVRGGCSCAGPYGHHLLGMDLEESVAIEAQIQKGNMLLRPGWVRLNLNYFISEATVEYLLAAVELVATNGWRMLPFYQYQPDLGVWVFQGERVDLELGLGDCLPAVGDVGNEAAIATIAESQYGSYLAQAQEVLQQDHSDLRRYDLAVSDEAEGLRWYTLPQDISLSGAKAS